MTKTTYKWKTPLEWLLNHIASGDLSTVQLIALRLAMDTDHETIQDLYQDEMNADGYFISQNKGD